MQRAAAALAQRKAVAARAAEEALEHGQGPKGPKQKRLPSAAFRSQSRQQVELSACSTVIEHCCCFSAHSCQQIKQRIELQLF